jgi:ankyrin repeat protein
MAGLPAVDVPGIDRGLFADLFRWCKEGNLSRLQDVLFFDENIFNYFTVKTGKGNTLLHEAVDSDQPDVIQLLLQHGVSPDPKGKNNQTPLLLAASKGHVLCVQALLIGDADLMAVDDLGNTAFMKAERTKKRDAVLRLLRSKGEWSDLFTHPHNMSSYY